MKLIFSILAAGMLLASAAQAAVLSWSATLEGTQEVPSVITDATGTATGTIDTVTFELTWDISWTDVGTDVTGLHIHNAPAGSNGGVVVNVGNISGLGSPSAGSTTIDAGLTSELLAGNLYINLHSTAVPSGEIRGQISAVPAPAAGILLLGGLMSLAALRRKRRADSA